MTKESIESVEDSYQLSPLQLSLLRDYAASEPESDSAQIVCDLQGELNVPAFEQAWQSVVLRNAVLRTTFRRTDLQQPIQEVRRRVEVHLDQRDWRNFSAAEQKLKLDSFLREDRTSGFELDAAPLMRLVLFRLAERDYCLLWTVHHLLTDGPSRSMILKEVFSIYESLCDGQQRRLEPRRPFHDFIQWLQEQDPTEAESFWKQTLKNFTAPTTLNFNLPEFKTSPGAKYDDHEIRLPVALTSALKSLAKNQGLTVESIVQGAWAILLSRYTNEEDLVFGVTTSLRHLPLAGIETMVGLLANVVPLRVRVSPELHLLASFNEQVAQRKALRPYEHTSLIDIQRLTDVPDGTPLFDILFDFSNDGANSNIQAANLECAIHESDLLKQLRYPLMVTACLGAELQLKIAGRKDRFDPASIKRVLEHFRNLLEVIAADPQRRIQDISLLGPIERRQVLVEWNETESEYEAKCLHELFAEQVERTPEQVAVVHGPASLTYRELDQQAEQLAARLRALGVGPEVPVGLYLERGLALVVGALGILKAGGAYVPLEPAYPSERLRYMLADTEMPVVVTQTSLAESTDWPDVKLVLVDEEQPGSESSARVQVESGNLAYIIYTSGSTGQAKGVGISHRNVAAFLQWARESFTNGELSGVLASTSICFDLAVFELFAPLVSGGRVILAENALQLAELPEAEAAAVTLINTVPSAMKELLRLQAVPSGVRVVNLAGEALSRKLVQEVYDGTAVERVWNLYGPTEDTTYSTWSLVPRAERRAPSIGRPLANKQVYLLDQALQPVPIGVVGELYMGGAGLARGYYRRAALTAERFIPNPFSASGGERLYRTGDLARYREDGEIEYLGRQDQQVKVRGYRIELGEIEAVLLETAGLREAVVVVREERAEEKQLVAYVVGAEGAPRPESSELRSYLQQRLPGYMVPGTFVVLAELPLTANGKVDRRALPAPSRVNPNLDHEYVGPRTPTEELLCGIWQDVLDVEPIGINDDFFQLGGHSLLATQMISRVHDRCRSELPLHTIFEFPTVAELATQIDKSRLSGEFSPVSPILPARHEATAPTSYAQQGLWFFEQLNPGTGTYNVAHVINLDGALDTAVLERSLNEIIRRHETLRTSFAASDTGPVQVIADELQLQLTITDLTQRSVPQRERDLQQLSLEEATRPFDLNTAPLLRAHLLQIDHEESVLLLTMHHIVSDGWSINVCLRELALIYDAFRNGHTSPLPPLNLQYQDFARWQRDWLQTDELETQLAYWRVQLQNLANLDLPFKGARPLVSANHGATVSEFLPDSLHEGLEQLSRQQGVTLYMTLLAAFQTLLARYSRQTEIVVGSPIANRRHAAVEDLIGLFVNLLVLRCQCRMESSFSELLEQVKEVALGAFTHQDVPFQRLVEELQPEHDLRYNPLFQVVFGLQNEPRSKIQLDGLTLEEHEVKEHTAKFDLMLLVEERAEGLEANLTYNSDLFDETMARQVLQHWQQVLRAVVENPQQKLGELPLLSEEEEREQLEEWNATEREFPRERCIQELFEAQVSQRPEAVAVVYGAEQLSYGELNERANQLAHYLRKRGVGPEVVVGVCLERSFELVVSLLGILKAGGAYLPLDAGYPEARRAYMLSDVHARVLLTKAEVEASASESKENPERQGWAENLAYVMYTSGSTGEPKGIGVTHRNVLRLVCNAEYAELNEQTVSLQLASVSFDAATFELWGALLNGGKLVLYPGVVASATELGELVREQGVETLWLTSALYNAVVEQGVEELVGLRQLLIGGEALSVSHVRRGLAALAGVELINGYGPTEVTTFSCTHRIRSSAGEEWEQGVPIGKPIGNTAAYVLDVRQELVPVGVVGELYLGGEGLARGYVGAAALTAERFVPHPFSKEAGARLYRTGDLVRYRRDGELEFMGRVDEQLKIRGFRIEPGEVESVLREHEQVAEAVVLGRQEESGEKRLVAYVVLKSEEPVSAAELREYLKERLPEYMVPAGFVYLAELPLNANGKLDRAALPAPEWEQARGAQEYVGPRTAVEEVLCGIWAEVLGVERVGIYDNFFDLGGHSLLATQVVSRIRKAFGLELSPRVIFDARTPLTLARTLAEERKKEHGLQPPPLLPRAHAGELPLSFAQQRLWFIDQLQGGSPFHNVEKVLSLKGALNIPILEQALSEIIRRHESLRTIFNQRDGVARQVICPPFAFELSEKDLSHVPVEQRQVVAEQTCRELANQPFNLEQGPVIHGSLLRLDEQEHWLLLVMHHIVTDGWSMGLLVRELTILYEAFSQGQSSPLKELSTQYGDFAVWQREWLRDESLEHQLAYWREQFVSGVPTLELPLERARPARQSFRGGSEPFVIDAELTEQLVKLSRREGVTLFMLLLAAWQLLLARYSGQQEIVIGADMANRNRVETEELIGFFVNMLLIRGDLTADPTFTELLKAARETCLGAYDHQDVPFELLVEDFGAERDLSRNPLFQVAFVLQNTPMPELRLGELELGVVEIETGYTPFDLVLSVTEENKELIGGLLYSTDLFGAAAMEQIARHYRRLLQEVVTDPERSVWQLPLLSEIEREQLLNEWNNTKREFPREQSLHQVFEQQVLRMPDAIAVVYGADQLTYRELNEKANQLAEHLRNLGVVAEVPVAFCLPRSVDMVISLLAILKAGGVYVPLDPEYPLERLAYILENSQAAVLITRAAELESMPLYWGHVVCLDQQCAEIGMLSKENVSTTVFADNLAYVMYTSGSTGVPKGIGVTHRSVLRLVCNSNYVQVHERDVVAQAATISFDASTFEIWGALLNGARVVGVSRSELLTPGELGRKLRAAEVSVLFLTTALFNEVVRQEPGAFAGVKHLLFGGEQVDVGIVRRLVEGGSKPARLLHVYGPTEVTTYATWSEVQEVGSEAQTIAIGRPLSNTEAYVLDGRQELVPVGVVGELYLGGEGLARGYVGAAELTAEKFVPHPFSQERGARLYRTGDLVRYRRDGELEFMGRVDEQLKIRGFRIEPGEVESVLREHEQVADAVVLGWQENGEKRLVAYVVMKSDGIFSVPTANQLRMYLREKLPEYMIPAGFVYLAELPLNANGKVDRAALPAPEWQPVRSEQELVEPRTAVEEVLCGIWAEVLRVERVGVYDNFFELGGDSILSIQIVAKAHEQGLNLSIQQLFQNPTISLLAPTLSTRHSSEKSSREAFSLISPADRSNLPEGVEDAYPLTMLQAGMIFHSEYSPEAHVYHDIFSYHLRAPFDVEVMRECLRDLTARHEVLRTSFDLSNRGEELQLVHEQVFFPLAVHDIGDMDEAQQEEVIDALIEAEKKHYFAWASAPLMRLIVHRRSNSSFQFTLSLHHVLLDGWSLATLLTEFFQHYWYRLGRSETDIAPPPRLTFREFVALELEAKQSEECYRYWHNKLAGSSVTTLPRQPQNGFDRDVKIQEVSVAEQTAAGLKQLCQTAGVPMKSVLLAAHMRVLSLLSGESDVVTGLACNGRPEARDGERLVGLFLNTLPFRLALSGGTWWQLVRDAFETEQELLEYRRYPLAELQRKEGRKLFDPLFNFVHYHVLKGMHQLDGFNVLSERAWGETNFALVVNGSADPLVTEVKLQFIYDTTEFSDQQISTISKYYARVLEAIADEPLASYERLSLLSVEERREQLEEWNATAREFPRERCIQELFEAQVLERPEAVAVVYGAEPLSYGELNERANQLANYLRKRGVGPEVVVGVCLERSLELVVSLLGILKAGGAYLPLDPAYPEARRAYMLSDAHARVLVTKEQLEASASESKENPERQGWAENLAYVMYTSGSTGEPKGIGVTHRNVLRLVCNAEYAELNEQTVSLQLASVSFDAATFELWGALLNGGKLVLYPGVVASATELGALVREQGVETLWLTSALYNAVVEQGVAELVGLRQLLIGGEALSVSHVRRGLAALAGVELINGYGPTEVTTFSCTHRIRSSAGEGWEQGVPIGKPIGNTAAYVLDVRQELVPVGVVGELYLGGEGLARGYVGAAALTAERFVPHPFSKEAGARLYRTGDLVRYRRDGELEFMGRVDEQLKIRGFRIEPGEVESVLREHEQVAGAVVLGRQEESGEKRLVAYVVLKSEEPVSAAELREYLKERLPEYMVPAGFVYLAELPLNANGKLDRTALPAPEWEQARGAQEYVGPRTAVEEVLCGIWAEVLGVERVGIYDNFFDLGGHSLLATRINSRLRQAFAIELPLRELFESGDIAELAGRVSEAQRAESPAVPQLERRGRREMALSYAQQRLWFIEQYEAGRALYNLGAGFRMRGELQVAALAAALRRLIARHESLRTRFVAGGEGRPVQVVEEPWPVELQVEAVSEAAVANILQEAVQEPFDLGSGRLLRVRLLQVSEQEHVLLLVLHHIVTDGWSMGVMLRELGQHYEAALAGVQTELPELAVQYGDYAEWQREWLESGVLEAQLSYWRTELGNEGEVLELPSDRRRPERVGYAGARIGMRLGRELTERLKELSRQEDVTLYMTLLAGWGLLLARYSGARVVRVGTPIANRGRAELEGLLGFMVNTVVVRVEVGAETEVRELLRGVREKCWEAYGHQEVPYEVVVEAVQRERDLSRHGLFEVMFALQQGEVGELELAGLAVRWEEVGNETARYDLTLTLSEVGGELEGQLEYRTDLYERERMERLLGHYEQVLAGMAGEVEARVLGLPLLSAAERREQLEEWNATARAFPRESCIQELFEAQVLERPEAVAVVYGTEQLSYGELNERANQLAHYLRKRGVGPEVVVGVCLERSLELVVSLLGILKAGGAYLPLDPAYPEARRAYMLNDAQARVLVTKEELGASASESKENPVRQGWAENLAYVMYTSGSTGEPKGIGVTHRSVLRLVCNSNYVQVNERDVVAQAATISFDASTFEIWGALLNGARVVGVSRSELLTPGELGRKLRAAEVSVLFLTTALFNEVVRQEPGAFAGVKHLLFGGEQVDVGIVRRLVEGGSKPARLLHVYGPTEVTTYATWSEVEEVESEAQTIAIGRPLSNTAAYVLDGRQELVPVGVVGELYLGGEGLARGYVGAAELTAERFVPHPFSKEVGARLYRTGDLVRYRRDGELEFMGRVDEQLKIRGFRIEPGEVESVLREHEQVAEAVVLGRQEESGEKRLVAYLVAAAGAAELSVADLRRYLGERLPEYMVPAGFVYLAELPLNANGKLDRAALPAPEWEQMRGEQEYVAPRTAVEEVLCGIWEEVLGVDRVGVYDNFFKIGGNSLLAMQVVSRVGSAFQTVVSLPSLFETGSVSGLSTVMLDSAAEPSKLERVAELLLEIRQLSDDEVETLLSDNTFNGESPADRALL